MREITYSLLTTQTYRNPTISIKDHRCEDVLTHTIRNALTILSQDQPLVLIPRTPLN